MTYATLGPEASERVLEIGADTSGLLQRRVGPTKEVATTEVRPCAIEVCPTAPRR
jgi:hypothetical protein